MPTPIEWCDETFNPWWGCEKVSPGCAHCYADTLSKRYAAGVQLWGDGHEFRFFGDKHWAEPLKWARLLPAKLGRRPRVFCASMADVFEERDELQPHRLRLFDLIWKTPELDWLLLTKRPEFARDWLGGNCERGFPNVWMGVSIENARFTWRADVLRELPAAVRFISAEPLLGSLSESIRDSNRAPLDLTAIDWVIVGGESGAGARPFHLEHARDLVKACMDQCVLCIAGASPCGLDALDSRRPAVFVKQLGAKPVALFDDLGIGVATERPLRLADRKGGDWDEWPADLRVREFPRSAA